MALRLSRLSGVEARARSCRGPVADALASLYDCPHDGVTDPVFIWAALRSRPLLSMLWPRMRFVLVYITYVKVKVKVSE